MHLQLVPARQGAQWVRLGLSIVARQPLSMVGLFLFVFMGSALLSELSIAGQALALALMPAVTVGFMLATRRVQQGQSPSPAVLLSPLFRRSPGHRLLWQQGGAYALAALMALLVSDALQGDEPAPPSAASAPASEPAPRAATPATPASAASTPESPLRWLDDPSVRSALVLRSVLVLLLSVPFWHSGALAHWHGIPLARALFFSSVACVRNAGAFTLYGLGWALLTLGMTFLLSLLALVGLPTALVWPVALAGLLALSSAFFASLYFTFADCFGAPDEAERGVDATSPRPTDP